MMGWRSSSSSPSSPSSVHEISLQLGAGWRKGPWTPEEDKLLSEYVNSHGEGKWSSVARSSGLNRSGKSCRLRWVNYLRPGLKRGQITPQEEGIIIELHALWGNKWSTIARYLPGRTDNEIKNYWRTHFKKKPDKTSHHLKREKQKAQATLHKRMIFRHQQQQQQKQRDPLPNIDLHADNYRQVRDNRGIGEDHKERDPAGPWDPMVEDKCCPVVLSQSQQDQTAASWPEFIGEDELWGSGLWNLDVVGLQQGHVDHTTNCNKMAMQNQANTIANNSGAGVFACAGDANGFCNSGDYYIF
ncbi:hypothetical protein CRG98_024264 [Punica granatum]|nr:hypothetical protein CRG98_024264 [Punica granatum]